tara:strand:+ start:1143 stop:1457 length:315 start_codon:yes stop_codon:yes gene_type:complete
MGIIYLLVENREEARYKIGITKYNGKKRIKNLSTGNSDEITVVAEFESRFNRRIETSLHNRYSTKRLKGEWFKLEKLDVYHFVYDCQALHDTFTFLEESDNPFI